MLSFDVATKTIKVTDEEVFNFLGDIYLRTRYLETVSESKLKSRFHGLIACILTINSNGTPQFEVPNNKDGIAFIELLKELEIRSWDITTELSQELRRYSNFIQATDIKRISNELMAFAGKKCLFKFTKKKYANNIVNGEIRFKSAASYNAEGYNIAIRDDELNIGHMLKGLRVELQDGTSVPVKQGKITAQAAADYYVSCFSADFDFKLFALFECDACVIITNAEDYIQTVRQEYLRKFNDHQMGFGPIEYIDTYRQLSAKHPIEFRKSIDYSYEKEWRFVAFPECVSENIKEVVTLKLNQNMFNYYIIQIGNA